MQQQIFEGPVYGVNNNFGDQPKPRTVHCTTLISEENEEWCRVVADAISQATGNQKYGKSTVINEAVNFYKIFYSNRHKLLHKQKMINTLLENI